MAKKRQRKQRAVATLVRSTITDPRNYQLRVIESRSEAALRELNALFI